MKSIWTQGLDAGQRQDHVQGLKNNTYIKQLRDILEAREKELVTKLVTTPTDGVWPFAQAHLNGRLFDLREVLSLLNFDQEDNFARAK